MTDRPALIVTGLLAAAGRLGLFLYAIAVDPSNDMITRGYVNYLPATTC